MEHPSIMQLEERVVNRIAAGEVVQRPVSALKEMLENSLDAGATQISITVKEGGNKLLQIQDNGSGVQKADLPLLCMRHATSKLSSYEDLQSIDTLGFRGEALASISFVAHLTVTTMTQDAPHGYRVTYRDGIMDPAGPKPCASVQGTTLVVEDLFYNVNTRKQALKSSSEELSRILDIVGRYSVYKADVAFSCKRQGETRADIHTLAGASRLDNIRAVYGSVVARCLLPFKTHRGSPLEQAVAADAGEPCFSVEGYISNADYNGKKTVLVLFINGRPVDCSPLKRALEATYAALLPKAAKPWVFLDLRMPGSHVDVNLHPTKQEVGFLYQDQLLETIREAVEELLLTSNDKRTYTQTQLPGAPALQDVPPSAAFDTAAQKGKGVAEHKLVRTDSRAKTLHTFLQPSQAPQSPSLSGQPSPSMDTQHPTPGFDTGAAGDPSPISAAAQAAAFAALAGGPIRRRGANRGLLRRREEGILDEVEDSPERGSQARQVRQRRNPDKISELTSVRELLQEVTQDTHEGLSEVLRQHTFVGMADETLALLQHSTRLYILNVANLSKDMFYQQALRRFESMSSIQISGAASIADLAGLAVELEQQAEAWREMDGSKEEVAPLIQQLLQDKAALLQECFAIEITSEGLLTGLPQLIEGYCPDLNRLPQFVLQLARDVDWENEKECFRGLAQALAQLYHVQAPLFNSIPQSASGPQPNQARVHESVQQRPSQQAPGPHGKTPDTQVALNLPDGSFSKQHQGIPGTSDAAMFDDNNLLDDAVAAMDGEMHIADAPVTTLGSLHASSSQVGDLAIMPDPPQPRPLCSQEEKLQHVILPAVRKFLKPSKQRATDGSVVELTQLEKLYKIFERC
ncbi:DNA mismatch repair protein [Trebouxia sp. C0009 RCD-2024]